MNPCNEVITMGRQQLKGEGVWERWFVLEWDNVRRMILGEEKWKALHKKEKIIEEKKELERLRLRER